MSFIAMLLSASLVWAQSGNETKWEVINGDFGVCESVADIGNSGYMIGEASVKTIDSALEFNVLVTNMRCHKAPGKPAGVEWAMDSSPAGNASKKLGTSAYIYDIDTYRPALFLPPKKIASVFERYFILWNAPDVTADVGALKEGQSITKQYAFGLRAQFEGATPGSTYYRFSGKFGLTVTWTLTNGVVSPAVWVSPLRK